MIDYSYPTMMAEKALKELHNAMLDRKYEEAIEQGFKTIVEARLAIQAIRNTIAKETKHGD